MIPEFELSGVLPPFTGNIASGGQISPYVSDTVSFVRRFSTTAERQALLQGFLSYRAALNDAGISMGFQWINGSFCENIELTENRAPNDIDVVTFMQWPEAVVSPEEKQQFIKDNIVLLRSVDAKKEFNCHSFFVDLSMSPTDIIAQTKYWYALFSHKRVTRMWKGMVELPLLCQRESEAQAILEAGDWS